MTDGPTTDRPDFASAPEDDPVAALERLQSLGKTPAADEPAARQSARPLPHARPRPAAAAARINVARIAAPAVFLVAVIVVVSLLFQSGMVGGGEKAAGDGSGNAPAAAKSGSPKAKTSPTSGAGTTTKTKAYVVKAGDTPSGIAEKYGVSLSELEELNPDKDFTTLIVGEKLKVPRP